MGIQSFIKSSLESCLDIYDAENITIGSETKRGVVEDLGTLMSLGSGGDNNERALRVVLPADSFATLPTSGQRATCRSKTWQLTTVDNSAGTLILDMIEPERRR